MAEALAGVGYPVWVACARERGRPVSAPQPLPSGVAVVSRANARYDFGSWAAVLQAHPHVRQARHVLLTNDSIIGPLTGTGDELGALLRRGEASGLDVYAATRGWTGAEHLQAYFLQFHRGTLAHESLRSFFSTLPFTHDRTDLVQRYEHGLTAVLRSAGLSLGAAWDPESFGFERHVNPYLCWRELLDAGFPFVKRRLLTHPRFATVRPLIVREVAERYGVDLDA